MKIRATLLMIVMLCGAESSLAESWKIAQLNNDVTPVQKPFLKTDLPSPLTVEHPLFTVVVPKGWSVAIGKDAVMKVETITIAPNSDLKNSETYFSISRRFEKSTHTLEGTLKAMNKPPRHAELKRSNGTEWVYATSTMTLKSRAFRQLIVSTVKNGNEFIVMANSPSAEDATYIAQFDQILGSLSLK